MPVMISYSLKNLLNLEALTVRIIKSFKHELAYFLDADILLSLVGYKIV